MPRKVSKVGGTRRGAGRPPLGADARSESIRIRVTPAVAARVQAAADAAKMSVSDWGLGVLVTALNE